MSNKSTNGKYRFCIRINGCNGDGPILLAEKVIDKNLNIRPILA